MKILKLLNKTNFILIIIFSIVMFSNNIHSNETEDIWNIEKNTTKEKNKLLLDETTNQKKYDIYELATNKEKNDEIFNEEKLEKKIDLLLGVYDPEDNDLNMDMWSKSNGNELKLILNKVLKMNLSKDAQELLNLTLLTNSYLPKSNISKLEFANLKTYYLIKNNDLELIKLFIEKNSESNFIHEIIRHYLDQYFSVSNYDKSCDLLNNLEKIDNDYLSKYKIYCLIRADKKEEAQLLYDLKKELGFKEIFFEQKFNYLMGFDNDNKKKLFSEKNILDFHLSHISNENFNYIPTDKTPKIIWNYLNALNLLDEFKNINLEDFERIKIIENATHNDNFAEKELFDLYKKFQFNINQLINAEQVYNQLSNYEGRALIYQKILLSNNTSDILNLCKILKNQFIKDEISNAFIYELDKILKSLPKDEIPPNLSSFYDRNIIKNNKNLKIKFDNKFIHQSKLLKYFTGEKSIKKAESELNEILKKFKKKKKYFVSTKDIILIESLKYDGALIEKKFEDLYSYNPDIPIDIQEKINNEDIGMILLRLVEIIGEDSLNDLGTETLSFIIKTLNILNIDQLRNKIILKVLPKKA